MLHGAGRRARARHRMRKFLLAQDTGRRHVGLDKKTIDSLREQAHLVFVLAADRRFDHWFSCGRSRSSASLHGQSPPPEHASPGDPSLDQHRRIGRITPDGRHAVRLRTPRRTRRAPSGPQDVKPLMASAPAAMQTGSPRAASRKVPSFGAFAREVCRALVEGRVRDGATRRRRPEWKDVVFGDQGERAGAFENALITPRARCLRDAAAPESTRHCRDRASAPACHPVGA